MNKRLYNNLINCTYHYLSGYMRTVNDIADIYNKRMEMYASRFDNLNKANYSEQGIEAWKRENRPVTSDLKRQIEDKQREALEVIKTYMACLETGLNEALVGDIKASFVDRLRAYSDLGLKVNKSEFEALKTQAKSIPEKQLLDKWAKNGNLDFEVYGGSAVEFPDADVIMHNFTDLKNEAEFFIKNYDGVSGGILKDGATAMGKLGSISAQNRVVEGNLKNADFTKMCDSIEPLCNDDLPNTTDAEKVLIEKHIKSYHTPSRIKDIVLQECDSSQRAKLFNAYSHLDAEKLADAFEVK